MNDETPTQGIPSSGGDGAERFADDAHRYRLESRIATGGMGEVWRATDTTLGRTVAVKMLKPEYADDRAFRTRFETEARHAAALHHPGIAAVYDFGEATGDSPGTPSAYLVMELVDGQPLSALMRPGSPMEPGVVAPLMAQAADALAAAHRAGIVHRDVKPANLIVTPDRTIKITDFGIARAADAVGITQTGQVMGTPQYLSPEQARGRTATAKSDVYALGCVAFECLAGRRPFQADSPVATAMAHLNEPVPELPSSVPGPLAAVVRRALAKEPDARWEGATAFAAALRHPDGADGAVGGVDDVATTVAPAAPSDATSVMPVAAPVPLDPTPTPTPTTTTTTSEGSGRRTSAAVVLLVVALIAAIILVIVLVLTSGDDDASPRDTASSPPTSQSSQPTQSSSAPESSAPATLQVDPDDYVGRDYRDVQAELGDRGLNVKLDELDNDGSHDENIVEKLNPTGTLTEGDTVTVSYWGPAPSPSDSPSPSSSTSSSAPSDSTSPSAAGPLGGIASRDSNASIGPVADGSDG
ncbi:serine/threonine protein kinase [Nocardioides acrostichi]|uniref:non-specific serine/threonine protein kinase n=1 Tax=Nocardioides acrostichi TaxID=2784339 RepID=A0A930V578_9ACTN|nr:serine/threonine protein kinase [Nocardioides acrostichi]MBF4163965.1 serine/threonine protein kinase [Nocardioides acrostichi]